MSAAEATVFSYLGPQLAGRRKNKCADPYVLSLTPTALKRIRTKFVQVFIVRLDPWPDYKVQVNRAGMESFCSSMYGHCLA